MYKLQLLIQNSDLLFQRLNAHELLYPYLLLHILKYKNSAYTYYLQVLFKQMLNDIGNYAYRPINLNIMLIFDWGDTWGDIWGDIEK
nr:MAG TPA: hypothetical protein [Caudoviricetes sp.]